MADITIALWRHGKAAGSLVIDIGNHREFVKLGERIILLLESGQTIEIQNDDVDVVSQVMEPGRSPRMESQDNVKNPK